MRSLALTRTRVWIPAALLLGVAACVTVNIYFPAAQVEKTAEKIVGDVYQQGKEQPPEEKKAPVEAPAEKPRSSLEPAGPAGTAWAWFGPAAAWAAEEATSVSNAAIRALKDQIAQRHQELLPFYQGGQVGINKQGYLEVRNTTGLALPQVATLKRLVEADNGARRQLYEEVARALKLKPEQVGQIEEIFAKEWRGKAQAGWSVQADNGQWGKK